VPTTTEGGIGTATGGGVREKLIQRTVAKQREPGEGGSTTGLGRDIGQKKVGKRDTETRRLKAGRIGSSTGGTFNQEGHLG